MTQVIGAFRDYVNVPTDKYAVGKAWELLQYCQLPDKTSRDISQHIKNFSRYFQIVIHLFHDFSRNPQRCSTEPWLGNTVVGVYRAPK